MVVELGENGGGVLSYWLWIFQRVVVELFKNSFGDFCENGCGDL